MNQISFLNRFKVLKCYFEKFGHKPCLSFYVFKESAPAVTALPVSKCGLSAQEKEKKTQTQLA